MSFSEKDLTNNLIDYQDNNSMNNITSNLSFSYFGEGETSAFKDIQEEGSNIKISSKYCLDYDINNQILYCPCCLSTVEIKFINKEKINIKCQKGWKKTNNLYNINNYFHENNIKMNNEEKIYNLYCRRHKEKNVFNKYGRHCISCKFDLCEDCSFIKRCENHDFKNLNLENNIKNFFDEYFLNNDKIIDESEKYFNKLLKVLLYTNEEFPNFKTLKSLESAYNFLKNENQNKEGKKYNERVINKSEENSKKDEDKIGIYIKERKDLTKKNLRKSKIYEINIDKKNFRNMRFLYKNLSKNKNIQFLTKLVLSGNNIKTIKPLVSSKNKLGLFYNLKHLDLSRNNLEDENINYIEKLNCINLKDIYLYTNMLTDYTIFNMINEKFENLEGLYLGFNRFQKNVDNLKELNFKKLKNIGLNYVFNEDNYKNMEKLKLKNVEKLYIQNNGISKLDVIEKMNLINVKEIYLMNNELDEIDANLFIKYSYLERIYLDDSILKIINFDKIKALKNFKYFDYNGIKINLDYIKEKGINYIKNLEIII